MRNFLPGFQEPETQHYTPSDDTIETIHVYPVEGGGILFTKTPVEEDEPVIIDNQEAEKKNTPPPTPAKSTQEKSLFPLFVLVLCFFLLFDMGDSILTDKVTPLAQITITPIVRTMATTISLPIVTNGHAVTGRILPTLTLTQSQTIQASGHRHQSAQEATGTLTLFNGQATAYTLAMGTVLTGGDGIQVATNEAVTIPPGNPPAYGQATVTAHAISVGNLGNIAEGDINTTLAIAVFVKNSAFTGGLSERDYSVVTSQDLHHVQATLTPPLLQSVRRALLAQLTDGEALVNPDCTPTVTSDHQIGDEATQVQVTVSQTCSALAYNKDALHKEAETLLTKTARNSLGAHFVLFGGVQVTILHATTTNITQGLTTLALRIQGTWIYQITQSEQEQIKHVVAGKSKKDALHLLLVLPGIKNASIQWSDFGDDTTLPNNEERIHFHLLIGV